MANGFTQYLKDTRSELHHVAWPTRVQTIVYTALVIGISVGVALYLGFFDFLFTTTLSRTLVFLPDSQTPAVAASTSAPVTQTPITTPTITNSLASTTKTQ